MGGLVALSVRPDAPQGDVAGLAAQPDPALTLVWERTDLFAETPLTARLVEGRRERFLELAPSAALRRPDVLVYLATGPDAGVERLPDHAYLLGRLSGRQLRRFPIPAAAFAQELTLYLYSLGHQAVIGSARFSSSLEDGR